MLVSRTVDANSHDSTKGVCVVTIMVHGPGKAYLDESRQDRFGPPVWSVCAYVTNWESSIALEAEWKGVLNHYGVPAFHNKDFLHGKKSFSGWAREKRRAFIVRLTQVAVEHMVAGIGCAIREADWREMAMPADHSEYFKFNRDPYAFCLFSVLGMISMSEEARREGSVRLAIPRPLDCVFDDKHDFRELAQRVFYWRKLPELDPDKILGRCSLQSDETLEPLQAADLLTYYITRDYIDTAREDPCVAEVIEMLRATGKLGIAKPDRERLQEFVAAAQSYHPPELQTVRRKISQDLNKAKERLR